MNYVTLYGCMIISYLKIECRVVFQ